MAKDESEITINLDELLKVKAVVSRVKEGALKLMKTTEEIADTVISIEIRMRQIIKQENNGKPFKIFL